MVEGAVADYLGVPVVPEFIALHRQIQMPMPLRHLMRILLPNVNQRRSRAVVVKWWVEVEDVDVLPFDQVDEEIQAVVPKGVA